MEKELLKAKELYEKGYFRDSEYSMEEQLRLLSDAIQENPSSSVAETPALENSLPENSIGNTVERSESSSAFAKAEAVDHSVSSDEEYFIIDVPDDGSPENRKRKQESLPSVHKNSSNKANNRSDNLNAKSIEEPRISSALVLKKNLKLIDNDLNGTTNLPSNKVQDSDKDIKKGITNSKSSTTANGTSNGHKDSACASASFLDHAEFAHLNLDQPLSMEWRETNILNSQKSDNAKRGFRKTTTLEELNLDKETLLPCPHCSSQFNNMTLNDLHCEEEHQGRASSDNSD